MNLPTYAFPSSDERRKIQAKFAEHMPADVAAALVLLLCLTRTAPTLTVSEHPSGLKALLRERTLVPLIEPNVLGTGRYTHLGMRPRPYTDTDGVMTAEWASPAAHEAALTAVMTAYVDEHGMVDTIAQRAASMGLDSWHSPITAVPVRHTYADGSRPVTRWLSLDGTARIVGARIGYARAWNGWLTDHPYAMPYAAWPADAVTVRKFLAAARNEAQRIADKVNSDAQANGDYDPDNPVKPEYCLTGPRIEDWVDIILPQVDTSNAGKHFGKGGLTDLITTWNFREHTGALKKVDIHDHYDDDVADALDTLDAFSGRDPYDIWGLDPADRDARSEVTDKEEEVLDFLANTSNTESRQASRAALFAVAVLDGKSLNVDEPYEMLRNYLVQNFEDTKPALLNAPAGITLTAMMLHKTLGEPDLSDLYGVMGDLDSGSPADVLTDPASPWFWLGAMQGISYAILLGHLPYSDHNKEPFAQVIGWLLATPAGREQVRNYVQACQNGKVRVPLVGTTEFVSSQRLHARAMTDIDAVLTTQ